MHDKEVGGVFSKVEVPIRRREGVVNVTDKVPQGCQFGEKGLEGVGCWANPVGHAGTCVAFGDTV